MREWCCEHSFYPLLRMKAGAPQSPIPATENWLEHALPLRMGGNPPHHIHNMPMPFLTAAAPVSVSILYPTISYQYQTLDFGFCITHHEYFLLSHLSSAHSYYGSSNTTQNTGNDDPSFLLRMTALSRSPHSCHCELVLSSQCTEHWALWITAGTATAHFHWELLIFFTVHRNQSLLLMIMIV